MISLRESRMLYNCKNERGGKKKLLAPFSRGFAAQKVFVLCEKMREAHFFAQYK
jgi:hypothetical protein